MKKIVSLLNALLFIGMLAVSATIGALIVQPLYSYDVTLACFTGGLIAFGALLGLTEANRQIRQLCAHSAK